MSEEKKATKTTAKKTATKATTKKTATKTAAKKPATKVAKTAKKAVTKTAAKKPATKAATKTTAKKTTTKAATKKTTTKTATKKTAAKTTKKATAKKAPAKKTTRAKKIEEQVVTDADLIKKLENEKEETTIQEPVAQVEESSTNEFGTTTVSAEVNKTYSQPVDETISQEEKKARKSGRKVIVTMVIVIILAIGAFLGLWYYSKITAHNKIVNTLDKLKAGDQETALELIDLTNTLGLGTTEEVNTDSISDLLITNNQNEENTTNTTSLTNEIIQQSKKDEKDYIDFFKKMQYDIIEEKADFVDGYVKVKITNKNIGKIIKKYYVRAFALSIQSAFSTQQSSRVQEKLDEYLKELLTSDDIENVLTDVTFKLKREGFEWKLDVNKEELCDAILPGLREQLKDFEF